MSQIKDKKSELNLEVKDILQVTQEGRKYHTNLTNKFKERKNWSAPNPKQILSIIPGSVISIEVKEGDVVKKGDRLMVYEAMKMHNIIISPMDGSIKLINVSEGDKLPKGHLLIELQ